LGRTLERLADLGVDDVLCTGDIVDGEGSADNAIRLLADAGVYAVRGNHNRWFLLGAMRDLPDALPAEQLNSEHRKWLETLPRSLRFEMPAGSVLLCHGLGDADMATLMPDDEGPHGPSLRRVDRDQCSMSLDSPSSISMRKRSFSTSLWQLES
jgi:hypothetical protein